MPFDARAFYTPLGRREPSSKPGPEQQSGAAVALIVAIARCMAGKPAVWVHESRGLTFVG